jgi:hypothetical protein
MPFSCRAYFQKKLSFCGEKSQNLIICFLEVEMLKAQIKEWVHLVRENKAKSLLVERGVGPVTADRIVKGNYKHNPKGATLSALLESMALSGITVTAVKSA